MGLATLYNYAPTAPVQITRENYNAVGGGDNIVGNIRRAFKSDTDFEIWDAAVLGTQLVDGVDYELRDLDNVLTNDAGYDVYSAYKILNVAYQACNLYITYKIVMSYNDAATANAIIATANTIIPNTILTEQGDIIYASAPSTPAALHHGAAAGYLLQSGGHAANPSWVAPPITLTDADITINSTLAKNTRNFINATTRLTLTLPAAMAKSDIIEIIDIGGYGYKIKPGASQTLKYFNIVTVTGEVTNSFVQSKTGYSSVKLVCETANTKWQATEIRDVYAGKGYYMGGDTGAVTAVIEDMDFVTLMSTPIAATLDNAKTNLTGVSSNVKGFALAGYTVAYVKTVEDMNFATETSAAIAGVLSQNVGSGAGVNSNTKGYQMGGWTGAVTAVIEVINFGTEATSTLGAVVIDVARYGSAGVSSPTKGYCMGGYAAADYSTKIDDLVFSVETSTELASVLDTKKSGVSGLSGTYKGYCLGGDTGAVTAVIENMDFATDGSAAIVAVISAAKQGARGVSGIVSGFNIGGSVSGTVIDMFNFNFETCYTITAVLNTAKTSGCGVSGCI